MNHAKENVTNPWSQFMIWLTKVTEAAIVIMIFGLTVIIALSVFLRYAIGYTIFFADEVARYLLVWIVFIASSLAIRTGAHVGVEIFQRLVPPGTRKAMIYASNILLFLFLLIVGLVSVVYLVPPLWTQVTVAMGIRLFWVFLCIPIGMFLTLLQLIDFLRQVR